MKTQPGHLLLPLLLAVACVLAPACGKEDNPVEAADRVCGGKSDFGARMTGGPKELDVCVGDGDVSVVLTASDNYSIRAAMSSGGAVYEFQFLVPKRDDFPVVLALHDSFAAAADDPNGVWVYYQEIPAEGDALESYEIDPNKGSFMLGFSDDSVMTATFSNISLKLRTQGTNPQDRGSRLVVDGFMSLSVD